MVTTFSNKAVRLHCYVPYLIDITGVSPSEGSINGGTMITIYGNYFDPNADSVEVLVGGKL